MSDEKKDLKGSENENEVLELIKAARTLKRQLELVRGIRLTSQEEGYIKKVLEDTKKAFIMFNV